MMERKIFMGEASCLSDKGLQIHLSYYLTEKTCSDGCGNLYGIRVEKSEEEGKKEEKIKKAEIEAEETPPITCDRRMAEELLLLLKRNLVTPMGLIPCVDDAMM